MTCSGDFGGPIKRDSLWFFAQARTQGIHKLPVGVDFWPNLNEGQHGFDYQPDRAQDCVEYQEQVAQREHAGDVAGDRSATSSTSTGTSRTSSGTMRRRRVRVHLAGIVVLAADQTEPAAAGLVDQPDIQPDSARGRSQHHATELQHHGAPPVPRIPSGSRASSSWATPPAWTPRRRGSISSRAALFSTDLRLAEL